MRRKLHPESGAFITTAAAFVVFVLLPSTIRATGADQQELLRTEGKRFEGKVVLGDDPGIDEYLAYASHNSPALRSAYYRWSSRSEMIPSVSSLPDPVLTYTWFGESVETRVGPQRQRFGVRQPIPWFGTLGLRGDVTREEAWAA